MGTIIVCYLVDDSEKIIIIGTGTIIFEPKMIREGRYAGHIEDIVVHQDYQCQGIAKNILNKLKNDAVEKKLL